MNNETRPDNSQHHYRGSLEPTDPKYEKNKFSNKKKIASFLAGAALTLGVIGIGDRAVNALRHTNPEKNETSTKSSNEQRDIANELKNFVADFGDRYSDPISTFYSNNVYENETGVNLIMTDKYISEYDTTAQMHEPSPLGFERYLIPKDSKIDQNLSMKIFNDYTSKELSLYMNRLAKNPNPEAVAIIDYEFTNYCSMAGNDNTPEFAFNQDNEGIATLMETAKSVVAKYGNAANYSVEPASNNSDQQNISYFDENDSTDAQAVDNSGKITEFSSLTDLGIAIESYNDQNFTQFEEIIKNFQLDIVIRPNSGYDIVPISIGQIANP